jgi:hypothetical protein
LKLVEEVSVGCEGAPPNPLKLLDETAGVPKPPDEAGAPPKDGAGVLLKVGAPNGVAADPPKDGVGAVVPNEGALAPNVGTVLLLLANDGAVVTPKAGGADAPNDGAVAGTAAGAPKAGIPAGGGPKDVVLNEGTARVLVGAPKDGIAFGVGTDPKGADVVAGTLAPNAKDGVETGAAATGAVEFAPKLGTATPPKEGTEVTDAGVWNELKPRVLVVAGVVGLAGVRNEL